ESRGWRPRKAARNRGFSGKMEQRPRPFWMRLRHASLNPSGRPRVAVVSEIAGPLMIHFVTHEFAPFRGGIATYVLETAYAAAQLGFPVHVIAPDYHQLAHPTDATENFPITRVPCSGRLTPAGIWSLARALANRRDELRESKIVLLSPGAQMAMMIARE